MKTDWDDAPGYLRSKKKPGPWRMVAILGLGSAITWGVIALFAKSIGQMTMIKTNYNDFKGLGNFVATGDEALKLGFKEGFLNGGRSWMLMYCSQRMISERTLLRL